jgi:hypothetical protein
MPCGICTHFLWNAVFGETPLAILRPPRRSTMIRVRRVSSKSLPARLRQINIAFESRWLQGMTPPERLRALTHLANVLILAAGSAIEERDHEPR